MTTPTKNAWAVPVVSPLPPELGRAGQGDLRGSQLDLHDASPMGIRRHNGHHHDRGPSTRRCATSSSLREFGAMKRELPEGR